MKSEVEGAVLSQADLELMRKQFRIPSGVTLRIPSPEEKPSLPKEGEVCLHAVAFDCGFRLPFHPFIRTLLAHFGLIPAQLGPNVWRHIVGSIILWRICSSDHDHITLPEFNYCYKFCSKMSRWYLNSRHSRLLVLGCPTYSAKNWSETFFFASGAWQGSLDSAPPLPTQWGFVDKDKLEEPNLTDVYLARVNRALAFDSNQRHYKNLITPENIDKYLLNNVPDLPSPSLADRAFCLDPKIFPESSRGTRKRKRRVPDTIVHCPPTMKLCPDAKRKMPKRSESSTITQTDSAQPKPSGFPELLVTDSSSIEGLVKIFGKEKKLSAPQLPRENNMERTKELLSEDEIKQMEALGSEEALLKSISYSAKGVAMMVALSGRLRKESKMICNHKETLAALQKTKKAFVDQLASSYMLSKNVEALKNILAKTEMSVKDRDEMIHAKDALLRAREEEICAKDEQIRTLKLVVEKFTETVKKENLTQQCYQSLSFPIITDWFPLEPITECDQI